MIADLEAEQADTTPEESSVVATPPRSTKSADTRAVEAYIQQSQRRDRYLDAVKALRNTLVELREGEAVSDRMVELLDALLDVETEGGTR